MNDDEKSVVPRKPTPQWLVDVEKYGLPFFILLAVVALGITDPAILLFTLAAIAVLAPSVIVHEWGHYLVARRKGLLVKEFSIGFGKRLWSHRSRKTGVLWSLKAIPLGGSVEVGGMTTDEVAKEGLDPRTAYIYASVWTRLRLSLAGVMMNVLLSWATLTGVVIAMTATRSPEVILLSPVIALNTLWTFLRGAASALMWSALNWNGGAGSILSLPGSIQTGLHDAVSGGMSPVVYFAFLVALVNLSLAVFNVLPMYPLDGYHAFVAGLDGVRNARARRRGASRPEPLSKGQLANFTLATGVLLAAFVILIFARDIFRMIFG